MAELLELDPSGLGLLEFPAPAPADWLPEGMSRLDEGTVVVRAVRVGRARYPLSSRNGKRGWFEDEGDEVSFRVKSFGDEFVGRGKSDEEALRNWCQLIHVSFQRLRATLDIQRTEGEQRLWGLLCEQLDVEAYYRSRPVRVRDRAEVVQAFPEPWEVRWQGGKHETVVLDRMPDDFGAFEVGDCFEALLDRDPETGETLAVYEVRPILPSEEAKDIWQDLPARGLPESDYGWTES